MRGKGVRQVSGAGPRVRRFRRALPQQGGAGPGELPLACARDSSLSLCSHRPILLAATGDSTADLCLGTVVLPVFCSDWMFWSAPSQEPRLLNSSDFLFFGTTGGVCVFCSLLFLPEASVLVPFVGIVWASLVEAFPAPLRSADQYAVILLHRRRFTLCTPPHPLTCPAMFFFSLEFSCAKQEGEAIFYRSSALELESRHDFPMRDAIPALEEFRGLLEAFPHLSTIVRERLTTVAQVAVFLPSSSVSSACGSGGDTGRSGGGRGAAGARQRRQQDEEESSCSSARCVRCACWPMLFLRPWLVRGCRFLPTRKR